MKDGALINRFDEIGKAARDAAGWHACLTGRLGVLVTLRP
jgi:hypothetical protein